MAHVDSALWLVARGMAAQLTLEQVSRLQDAAAHGEPLAAEPGGATEPPVPPPTAEVVDLALRLIPTAAG